MKIQNQPKLDSIIYGCGLNDFGQLGLKESSTVKTPTGVTLPNKAERIQWIASGDSHSIFLSKYGELYFVGKNTHGIVEGGEEEICFVPKLISGSELKVISIVVNQY